jgi:predicted GTPase
MVQASKLLDVQRVGAGDQQRFQLRVVGAALLAQAQAPLYFIGVYGISRVGKSSLLNAFAAALRGADGFDDAFTVGACSDPVTAGIDVLVLPKQGCGSWVLIDTEGLGNQDQSEAVKNELLALVYQLTPTHVGRRLMKMTRFARGGS